MITIFFRIYKVFGLLPNFPFILPIFPIFDRTKKEKLYIKRNEIRTSSNLYLNENINCVPIWITSADDLQIVGYGEEFEATIA